MYYRRTAEVNNILNNFVSCILTVTIEKGKVEFENLKKIPGKGCYANPLTPKCISEKSISMDKFIKRKRKDYEVLNNEMKIMEEVVPFVKEFDHKETTKSKEMI